MALGGIILRWGESYPKAYSLEISSDDKDWKEVFRTNKGNGNQDWVYFNSTSVRAIKVKCVKEAGDKAFVLKNFELKSVEEQAMPQLLQEKSELLQLSAQATPLK